jgi:hypothetical protein
MSVLYIKDASSMRPRLNDGLTIVTMMSRFAIEYGLLHCRKYKVNATSTNSSFISQQASAAHCISGIRALWARNLLMAQPWSLWCHAFLFSLPCSAPGNIRLLLHQHRVHSFHNTSVQTPTQSNYLFRIYRPKNTSLKMNVQCTPSCR